MNTVQQKIDPCSRSGKRQRNGTAHSNSARRIITATALSTQRVSALPSPESLQFNGFCCNFQCGNTGAMPVSR